MSIQNARARAGFTLIELLVVIAIISILAAILFPVFAQAREKARAISCASNLRQIALAYQQYVQDHDGSYPSSWAVDPAQPGWAVVLQPYVHDTGVFQCPSDRWRYTPGDPIWFVTTYWSNGNLNQQPGGAGTQLIGVNEAVLTAPALTVLVGDGVGVQGAGYYNQCGNGNSANSSLSMQNLCPAWNGVTSPAQLSGTAQQHQGGSNYAFTDGHVRWLHGDAPENPSGLTGGWGAAQDSGGKPTFGL